MNCSIYHRDTTINTIIDSVSKEINTGLCFIDSTPVVTIFGSARILPTDPIYKSTVLLSEALAKKGFNIMTGGGPGIMEAANRGASIIEGKSYGINIELPCEQEINPYVDQAFVSKFLFTRKILLIKNASAFIFVNGGFGTLDELFEVLTLISIEHLDQKPIILYNKRFWQKLMEWMKDELLSNSYIDKSLFDHINVVDDISEVLEILEVNNRKIVDSKEKEIMK